MPWRGRGLSLTLAYWVSAESADLLGRGLSERFLEGVFFGKIDRKNTSSAAQAS